MEKKKILVLAGIFLALLVLVLILERPEKAVKQDTYLVRIDSSHVDKITIIKKDKETTLLMKADGWVVANQDNTPADREAIADILQKLGNLKTVQLVSKNPEKVNLFEVDAESGTEVKVEGKDVSAHFYIGKNGADFNSNYIRREGSDAVYLSAEFIGRSFDNPDFRSRKIFDLKDRRITRLAYKFPHREIELVRQGDDSWKQTKEEPYNADQDAVVSLIVSLKGLRVDEFVKKPDAVKFEDLQLELSFNCQDGYGGVLAVAQKGENETSIFIKSASATHQYKVSEKKINRLTEKLSALKPPAPAEEKSGQEVEETGSFTTTTP